MATITHEETPKRYFFDVGANDGNSLLHIAQESPNYIVYAFEPTPRLIDIIKSKTSNLPNYHLIPKAVADYNGTDKFYISGNADWGTSSLCKFNDNLEEKWPGRTDFKVTDSVDVDVIRLETFLEENQHITSIDYLHVDVQGKDLEVLFGLGKYLTIVKEGVIEMPTRHDNKLYKNQKYLAEDAIVFLKQNGFEITQIQPNDIFMNEVNIHFKMRGNVAP
jgi:FkbM family methyltransferase